VSATTEFEPSHPRDDPQLTVVAEAIRILLDQPLESDELVAWPWIGLHFRNEHL
jgi:hypothetical protein